MPSCVKPAPDDPSIRRRSIFLSMISAKRFAFVARENWSQVFRIML